MAAILRHRKLTQPSLNDTALFSRCTVQCDPLINFTGFCYDDCIPFCPSFCHPSQSSPTPSPATSPYTFPPPPPPTHHHQPLSLPLKISLVFLFTTVVYTLYKFFTVWYRSRPHRTPSPENQETADQNQETVFDVEVEVDHPIWYIRTTGLQQSVINSLTIVKFSKSETTVVEGTDCSVCLTEFEEDDMLRLLPNCKHAFHMSCIDTWLRSHTNCPLCRAVIVNNTVNVSSSEQIDEDDLNNNLGVLSGGDHGEASGSSGFRIGERDEDDLNNK
ncbi:hypothetical protein QVD17_06099 [Tagetes erecta]|uniref:RING-type E3 ubiquitin transferase n=1 Tax=Tagetes erecta TaxID=13708 RepID=A0AAD8LG99_TARER|nr:hypothetical protein QVD17_06099 [Tagetes erecta]